MTGETALVQKTSQGKAGLARALARRVASMGLARALTFKRYLFAFHSVVRASRLEVCPASIIVRRRK